MKILKFILINFFIISFFGSSVLGTSISLCLEEHKIELVSKKSMEREKSTCHDNAEKTKKYQLCFDCDCNIAQVNSNTFSIPSINFVKFVHYELFINNNSIEEKIKDPPPRINT